MPPAVVTKAVADRTRPPARWPDSYGFLLLLCLLGVGFLGLERLGAVEASSVYTVLRVYDGDTILIEGSGGRKTVRLLGIDAPETSKGKGAPGQPYSRQAQRHLADLVLNRTVTLAVHGEDRYQRILAVVYCGNRDVNHAMIRAGMAEVYRGRTPETFDKAPYLKSEAEARRSQTGMWRQENDYVSPIRWKHPR